MNINLTLLMQAVIFAIFIWFFFLFAAPWGALIALIDQYGGSVIGFSGAAGGDMLSGIELLYGSNYGDSFTGGDNGILGVWPDKWAAGPASFYWLSLGIAALAVTVLRVIVFSPFGFALRATRDSPLRSEAIGINLRLYRWMAFVVSGVFAGVAGALFGGYITRGEAVDAAQEPVAALCAGIRPVEIALRRHR